MTIKEGQRYLCLGGECRCGCGTVYEPVSLIVTQVQLDQESFDGWVHSTVLDDNDEPSHEVVYDYSVFLEMITSNDLRLVKGVA